MRVKAILSADVVKVRPRVTFFCVHRPPSSLPSPSPSKTISASPAGVACRGGHHSGKRRKKGRRRRRRLRGAVACPVSRRGIARDISPPSLVPPSSPSRRVQLPQMTIAATSRSPIRRFITRSPQPLPRCSHQPPTASLASVSSSHVMPRSC